VAAAIRLSCGGQPKARLGGGGLPPGAAQQAADQVEGPDRQGSLVQRTRRSGLQRFSQTRCREGGAQRAGVPVAGQFPPEAPRRRSPRRVLAPAYKRLPQLRQRVSSRAASGRRIFSPQ